MNHPWMVVRIGLVLAAIFSLGVWVGRMTAPVPVASFDAPSDTDSASSPHMRKVVGRYRHEVGLSEQQLESMREHFLEADREMRGLARDSPERVKVIERFHREIAPILNEEQQRRADALLEDARERHLR